ARDEHQRAVELVHLVEEDGDVHCARLRHLVVALAVAVVLRPRPDVAVESHLAVDLELVHVDLLAEELLDRPHHARMAREARERGAIKVRREIRAHHATGPLAHVLGALLRIERRHLVGQRLDFLRREERRKEHVAFAVELLQLGGVQLHGNLRKKGAAAFSRETPRPCLLFDDLEEDLVRPEQAELVARALLDRLEPLFQVANLRGDGGIAGFQPCVLLALRRDLLVELPDAEPSPLAEPQGELDGDDQRAQDAGQDLHVIRNWPNAPRPGYDTASPRSSSMRRILLYFAMRSERDSDPVLICSAFVPTARSAIVVSSVSPER